MIKDFETDFENRMVAPEYQSAEEGDVEASLRPSTLEGRLLLADLGWTDWSVFPL